MTPVFGVAPTVPEDCRRLRRIAITPTTPNAMAATMMSTHAQAGRPPPDADEPAGVAVAVTVVVGVLVVVVVVDELLACDATAAPAAPAATAAPLWREAVDVVVTVLVFVLVLVFVFVLVTVLVLVFVLVLVLVTVVVCGAVVFVVVVALTLAAAALLVACVRAAVIVPDALSDFETLEATLWLPPVPQPPATSAHAPISAATATRCVPLRRTTT